jgi:hypothetical protein
MRKVRIEAALNGWSGKLRPGIPGTIEAISYS